MALFIVIVGSIAALIYSLSLDNSSDKHLSEVSLKEQIILPQYPPKSYAKIDIVQEYLQDLKELYESNRTVLPLRSDELDAYAKIAQEVILKDEQFLADTRVDGAIMHNDMMSIRAALIGSLSSKDALLCDDTECYEATKYNFATDTTTKAIVDVDNREVLSVSRYPSSKPDISLRLKRIAQAITLNAPEIEREVGAIKSKDISMANVKGSLVGSICEKSSHLCVAPTITDHHKQRALWAIIDLTDLKLVAAKWAGVGKSSTPACISERVLQNRHIMQEYCKKETTLRRGSWSLRYRLTLSDGLEVRDVSFNGTSMVKSAKIVDWHVSYKQLSSQLLDEQTEAYIGSRRVEFVEVDDGYLFGYNDAMGCPMFSTSVVLAFNSPQVRDLLDERGERVGFYLVQDFRNPKWPLACNYRYENRFLFYDDGRFATVGVNIGRGCGESALYRPIFRIDLASSGETLHRLSDSAILHTEQTIRDLPDYKTPYQVKSDSTTYSISLLRSDNKINSTTHITTFKESEGDIDLLTLGSCCDLDNDGVEQFIDTDEPIEDMVIWHVPRIKSSGEESKEQCWADTQLGSSGNFEVQEWPCSVGIELIMVDSR